MSSHQATMICNCCLLIESRVFGIACLGTLQVVLSRPWLAYMPLDALKKLEKCPPQDPRTFRDMNHYGHGQKNH